MRADSELFSCSSHEVNRLTHSASFRCRNVSVYVLGDQIKNTGVFQDVLPCEPLCVFPEVEMWGEELGYESGRGGISGKSH
jgi:hypothetical protein